MRTDLPLAALDAALVSGAYLLVLVLRFDGAVPATWSRAFWVFLPGAIVCHLAANWVWGLYGQMWLQASVPEARRVLLAGGTAVAILAVIFLPGARQAPLSVHGLGGLLATALIGGLRFQSRLLAFRRRGSRDAQRIIVIGAGDSGAAIVREMLRNPDAGFKPVALLDDDRRKQGRALSGVRVVGDVEALPDAVARYRADQALLAVPSADGELVRRLAAIADSAGLALKVLPSVGELVGGRARLSDMREPRIEDLLGRQQVKTDLEAVRAILQGRRVLITGAGGSIGAEITRQVAQCGPADLLLLDHDETHLHDAAATLGGAGEQVLADVRDRAVIDRVFVHYRPDVVFHAAAHKHVPLLERHACEAVRTNVLGTRNVVAAAAKVRSERFVLVSTDKAVRPSSVMGASKWLCEQIVLTYAAQDARFCAVRFGNVLASRGSVIPTFQRQIEAGGPVTVTDPRMTRFFMSISEAVQLVLQAAVFARGGEVFMLEMGRPIRIMELAERMIRLSGQRVGTDVPIRVTGMREGEKLHEELRAPDEPSCPTLHPSIMAVTPRRLRPQVVTAVLTELTRLAARGDHEAASRRLLALASSAATPSPGGRVIDLRADDGERLATWDQSVT